jgi:hypothetical protein
MDAFDDDDDDDDELEALASVPSPYIYLCC